jgi:hypothetical protein
MLSQCHKVLVALHQHVSTIVRKHAQAQARASVMVQSCSGCRKPLIVAKAGGARAPINNAAYAAAYLLDPHYAVDDIQDGQVVWIPPDVSVARRDQAVALVQRMGGPEAARKMSKLMFGGYPTSMSRFAEAAEEKDCLCHQAEQQAQVLQRCQA